MTTDISYISPADEGKCDVCHDEDSVGVACVPGIPMSVAYGRNCLAANAHPEWALRGQVILCGGIDAVDPNYLDKLNVWVDGEYMTCGSH